MMRIALRFTLLSLFFIARTNAQNKADSSAAFETALQVYHNFLKPQTGLYNGREYINYAHIINEGSPFYIYPDLQYGSVVYDNVLYEHVPVMYDVLKNEIIISDSSGFRRMYLNNEIISSFTIAEHRFIKLLKDEQSKANITPGFYEILYSGKNISLYKKQIKSLQESVTLTGVDRFIEENEQYYINKENKFFEVSSKGDVLKVLNDKKKELQQFIKKNKLKLKKTYDDAFTRVAQYYDALK